MQYGLVAALSRRDPAGLGWIVALAGVGGTVSGIIQASVGEPTAFSSAVGIVATVITLWLLLMGVLLVRNDRLLASTDQSGDNEE